MIELLLVAIWITYAAIFILHFIYHRKISQLERKQQERMEEIRARWKFLNLSVFEKQKLAHQWLSHCAATGIKIPYHDFVIDQLKEVPSE